MCTILSIVAQSGKKLGTLVKPLMRYEQSGEINFENEDKDATMSAIEEEFGGKAGFTTDRLDGVTLDGFAKHGWWCNIRKSNTEPLLRLNCEAKDDKTLAKALGLITPRLGKRVEH
jgi:phosphomannomutase